MMASFWSSEYLLTGFLSVSTLIFVIVWVRVLETYLRRKSIMDIPGDRSSHTVPTPRGGGLAVTGTLLIAWIVLYAVEAPPFFWALILGAGFCGWISWQDDRTPLSPVIRLVIHAGSVAIGAVWLLGQGLVFQGLMTPWLDLVIASLVWIGFVNFFNFMDGIDGISAVESGSIAGGLVILSLIGGAEVLPGMSLGAPLTIAAAALGFAVWNWSPARIFLGDVGSVPLGFLLGGLLLGAAAQGLWVEALILPLYYLLDAGLTLARRILRREKFWRPHREHFYQKAVRRGLTHGKVSTAILVTNMGLIGLAVSSSSFGWLSLMAAFLVVGLLLLWMMKWPHRS